MNSQPAGATPCPLCGSPVRPHWPTRRFFQCQSCRLLIRNAAAADLENLYRGSWADDPGVHTEATGATDSMLAGMYLARLARSLGRKDLRGLRILDFGAGRGAMLAALREAGTDAIGVEPYGFDYLRSAGFAVHPEIESLPRGISFDGIICVDVVEHLPKAGDDLAALRSRLAENGWIYLSTPNAAGIKARILRDRWSEARNPGHLLLFTPCTMAFALERSGYRRVRRLKWFIDYRRNPAASLLHRILQTLWMDGELRYLGYA
jgi:2-polyprenyl-3-methyl-5-hydroxy-6-metoxy-1,4-benzoquinol methylase